MALEPIHIERVREITALSSLVQTEALCARLNPVQEAETVADIGSWMLVRDKFTRVKGGKLGVEVDKSNDRLAIQNRIRIRLGLSPFEDDKQTVRDSENEFINFSMSLTKKITW